MGYIPDEIVEEIRARADIVQIIGETVTLKKVGRRMVGLCPFHKDSKPSFYVNPDRGAFKCFGCGIGGDVFRFIMEIERLTFPEAVQQLGDRLGIEIPKTSGPSRPRGYRERLLTITAAALSFFRERLSHPEVGRGARDYLAGRKVSDEMIKRFELGFAPNAWDHLTRHLMRKGLPLDDAIAVGLIAPRESGDGHYDRFRNRLMFPIYDVAGRPVAFSGRLLDGDGPKYINSPESDIYVKGRTFYGLHLAGKEISDRDEALICEGNFDVVALNQFGFTRTLAPLGTAFTEMHAALVERYTKNVTFIFDGDEAGRKAMAKLLDVYIEREEQPKVVILPEGEDPDSFLKAQGAENLTALLANAPFLLDFVVDRTFAGQSDDAEGMARALDASCRVAARLKSPIRRGLLAKTLSARTKIAEEEIRRQIERARRGVKAPRVIRKQTEERLLPGAERTILATLLHYPSAGAKVDREALLMALPAGAMRKVAERMLAAKIGEGAHAAEVLMHPDDDEQTRSLAGELLMLSAPCRSETAEQALTDAILDRERRNLAQEIETVKQQLEKVGNGQTTERADELEQRLFALRRRLTELRQ